MNDAYGKYLLLYKPLRTKAQRLGYSLSVHGSLSRDIDLIACPWAEGAVSQEELAHAFKHVIERVNGFVVMPPHNGRGEALPIRRPHGRTCWVYHVGSGTYIDLSVMPRNSKSL